VSEIAAAGARVPHRRQSCHRNICVCRGDSEAIQLRTGIRPPLCLEMARGNYFEHNIWSSSKLARPGCWRNATRWANCGQARNFFCNRRIFWMSVTYWRAIV